jgi:hypothetical protein
MAVFVSHATQDRDSLKILTNALRKEGAPIYVAEEDVQAGRMVSSKITQSIRESDVLIALLTRIGVKSPTVHQEIGYAFSLGNRIVAMVEKGAEDQVGALVDGLEQVRFDLHDLPEKCAEVADYASGIAHRKRSPYLFPVSSDFRLCRAYAEAFHNSETVRELILHKYEGFLELQDFHFPRIFNDERTEGLNGHALLERLQSKVRKASETRRDKVLADFMAHTCEIDAAIVAYLEIRKAWNLRVCQDEFDDLFQAYHRRLTDLYINEVPFGRSDVHRFFHDNAIVWLVYASEIDAIDYIDSCLTSALWWQLNAAHGWFDVEADETEKVTSQKAIILEEAKQHEHPFDLLPSARNAGV